VVPETRWARATPGAFETSNAAPAAAARQGSIFVPNTRGNIVVLRPDLGKRRVQRILKM
jgi:hypothetical protein